MKRKINLYQSIFHKQTDFLSASYLGMFLGITALFLSFFSIYEHWQVQKEEGALLELQETHKRETQKLEDIQKQFPEKAAGLKLSEETSQLEKLLTTKQDILSKMTAKMEQKGRGFLDFLQGLARQKTEGLWLERIHLREGGNHIMLSGQALRPNAPFLLLQRLGEEDAFKGKEFNTFALQQTSDGLPTIHFVLQTKEDLEKNTIAAQEAR
ncbi:MAG: hypothetical protein HY559_05510 [Gammaproteobacteria bacterium]|nr:hypothetical protein [Gammaproteobacteria bacterium]